MRLRCSTICAKLNASELLLNKPSALCSHQQKQTFWSRKKSTKRGQTETGCKANSTISCASRFLSVNRTREICNNWMHSKLELTISRISTKKTNAKSLHTSKKRKSWKLIAANFKKRSGSSRIKFRGWKLTWTRPAWPSVISWKSWKKRTRRGSEKWWRIFPTRAKTPTGTIRAFWTSLTKSKASRLRKKTTKRVSSKWRKSFNSRKSNLSTNSFGLKAYSKLPSRLTSSRRRFTKLSWHSSSRGLKQRIAALTNWQLRSVTKARSYLPSKSTLCHRVWPAKISRNSTSRYLCLKRNLKTPRMMTTWLNSLHSLTRLRSVLLRTYWTFAYRPVVSREINCPLSYKARISLMRKSRRSWLLTFTTMTLKLQILLWRTLQSTIPSLALKTLSMTFIWDICKQTPFWSTCLPAHLKKNVKLSRSAMQGFLWISSSKKTTLSKLKRSSMRQPTEPKLKSAGFSTVCECAKTFLRLRDGRESGLQLSPYVTQPQTRWRQRQSGTFDWLRS